jgi:4-oxalocrotonate tautomerase family enzyme
MAFVSIREGRPPETIRRMISAVTAAIAESLDAPPASIRVVVTEVSLTRDMITAAGTGTARMRLRHRFE